MVFNNIFIKEVLMVLSPLMKKIKNISVIINARTSSIHFDYGHFVDAHDIPEVFMLRFSL